MSIKTIDINTKEWFDKANGNSYFSSRITVNFGLPDTKTFAVPFGYGYGSQHEYTAFKTLQEAGLIPVQHAMSTPWRYYSDNGIITRINKEINCLKKYVIAHGIL